MTRRKLNLSTGSEVNKQGRDGRGVEQNTTIRTRYYSAQRRGQSARMWD